MQMSMDITLLAVGMCKVQAEIENVVKDKKNPFFKSSYADLGSILDMCRPILSKHGLSVVQFPCHLEGQVGVKTMLMHESGQWMYEEVIIPIESEKGKSIAQTLGSIVTYLRRYSYAACVGIAQVDDDGNIVKQVSVPAQRLPLERLSDAMRADAAFKARVLDYTKKLDIALSDLTNDQIEKILSKKEG
jgi:hypothetical protein